MTDTRSRALIDISIVLLIVFGLKYLLQFLAVPFAGPMAVAASFAVMLLLLKRGGIGLRELGIRKPSGWRDSVKLIVLTAAAMAGTVLLALVIVPALIPHTGEGFDRFDFLRGDLVALILFLLIVAWGTAAIGEESIFRGFLLPRLESLFGGGALATVAALTIQAIIFGLAHSYQGLHGIVLTGLIGLVMGLVYLAGNRWLLPVILAHGLIDTISLVGIYQS